MWHAYEGRKGFFPTPICHCLLVSLLLATRLLDVASVAALTSSTDCASFCRAVRKRDHVFTLKCIARDDADTTEHATASFCEEMCSAAASSKDTQTTNLSTCAPKRKRSLLQLSAGKQSLKAKLQGCPKAQPCNCKCVCPETVYQTVPPPALFLQEEKGTNSEFSPIPVVPNFDPPPPPDWRQQPCPEFEPCNCYCHCRRPVEEA
ncbi:unnamed protein product [Amoebophrya sp. A120]|nr:unnamed protein product [Amoebophrya sp. A120]|eukprot:GSA120T00006249001.1